MKHEIYTFRARSLADAIHAVREHLGPDAAVLETRRLAAPLASLLGGATIEVTASIGSEVPSRLPSAFPPSGVRAGAPPSAELEDSRRRIQQALRADARREDSLVERLAAASRRAKCPQRQ